MYLILQCIVVCNYYQREIANSIYNVFMFVFSEYAPQNVIHAITVMELQAEV